MALNAASQLPLSANAKHVIFICISLSLATIALFCVKGLYLLSPLLVEDDKILLTNIRFFGEHPQGLHFQLLSLAFSNLSVGVARPLLALVVLSSYSVAYLGFARLGGNLVILVFGAALVTVFPLSTQQFVFVNGSHAVLSLPFIVAAFLSAQGIMRTPSIFVSLILAGLVCMFMLAAQYMTNVAYLLSLAFLSFMPKIALVKHDAAQRGKAGLVLLVSIVPSCWFFVKYFALPASRNHYASTPGWLNTDFSFVLRNYFENLIFVGLSENTLAPMTTVAGLLIAGTFYTLFFRKRRVLSVENRTLLVASDVEWIYKRSVLFWMLIGFLALVPVSVVTAFRIRYVELPTVCFLIAGLATLAYLTNHFSMHLTTAISMALVFWWTYSFGEVVAENLELPRENAEDVQRELRRVAASWKENPQVVVIGGRLSGFPSFNHWSSGYLRHLSGRADVIGLVGSGLQHSSDPIVPAYRDHGEEYWGVTSTGRAFRRRMIGLEHDRPTYIYTLRKDGRFEEIMAGLVFRDGGEYLVAESGRAFKPPSDDFTLVDVCSMGSGWAEHTLIFGTPAVPEWQISAQGRSSWAVGPNRSASVAIPATQGAVFGDFVLRPGVNEFGSGTFGDFFPPTPILWRENFQLWQMSPEKFAVSSGDVNLSASIGVSGDVRFRFLIVENCLALLELNGTVASRFGAGNLTGELSLGKGFLQRTWEGEINGFIASYPLSAE